MNKAKDETYFTAPAVTFELSDPEVGFTDSTEPDPDMIKEAAKQAELYAEARNKNKRTARAVDPKDEAGKEGQASALAWLARRARSKIRK
jgi:hypothetical protein